MNVTVGQPPVRILVLIGTRHQAIKMLWAQGSGAGRTGAAA